MTPAIFSSLDPSSMADTCRTIQKRFFPVIPKPAFKLTSEQVERFFLQFRIEEPPPPQPTFIQRHSALLQTAALLISYCAPSLIQGFFSTRIARESPLEILPRIYHRVYAKYPEATTFVANSLISNGPFFTVLVLGAVPELSTRRDLKTLAHTAFLITSVSMGFEVLKIAGLKLWAHSGPE